MRNTLVKLLCGARRVLLGVLRRALPVAFWLLVWELCSRRIGQDLLLPSPGKVLECFAFVKEESFWQIVGTSLERTAAAYAMGIAIACVLAVGCHASRLLDAVVSPALQAVRATPVASFSLLAWLWLSKTYVPVLIGILMVVPVVFANVREGIQSTDRQLLEMARMFGWGRIRTWLRVVIPSVLPTFAAACEASVGMCFKATMAAEVICRPAIAIGYEIYTAKNALDTNYVLAWTIVGVLLSVVIEQLVKLLLKGGLRCVHRA